MIKIHHYENPDMNGIFYCPCGGRIEPREDFIPYNNYRSCSLSYEEPDSEFKCINKIMDAYLNTKFLNMDNLIEATRVLIPVFFYINDEFKVEVDTEKCDETGGFLKVTLLSDGKEAMLIPFDI